MTIARAYKPLATTFDLYMKLQKYRYEENNTKRDWRHPIAAGGCHGCTCQMSMADSVSDARQT